MSERNNRGGAEMARPGGAPDEGQDLRRVALEVSGVLLVVTDPEGRIVQFSPGCERLTGSTFEAARGRRLWELFREAGDAPGLRPRFEELLAGTPCVEHEGDFLAGDGTPRRIVWTGILVGGSAGTGELVVVGGVDVTERKRLEAALALLEREFLHLQKLEGTAHAACELVHDFANLLGLIQGYSGLLLAAVSETDAAHRSVEQIRGAADRAAALARGLLDLSRKEPPCLREVDVNQVIAGLAPLLRHLLGGRIGLVTALGPGVPPAVADAGWLQQVILNLLFNARDAMPAGGHVTIGTVGAELDATGMRGWAGLRPGAYVRLIVADMGCGMDDETQRHLYEPFFSTRRRGGASGLGLAAVRQIVRACGGDVRVRSAPGRGTTVEVLLPQAPGAGRTRRAATASAAAPAKPAKSARVEKSEPAGAMAPAGAGRVVLVVDDNDAVRNLVCEFLRLEGFTVVLARDGDEALELCRARKGPVDLLVTDLVMPEMGGHELAERLATICPGLKVLFISGDAGPSVAQVDGPAAGTGRAFLLKPFLREDLVAKVRKVLDGP